MLLFSVTRGRRLLLLLAVWEIVAKYRNGVARAAKGADHAPRRAGAVVGKADELVREAKGLEWQAMQLAATAVDDREAATSVATIKAAEVKNEVERMVTEAQGLEGTVERVRKLAEQEGDLESAEKWW